ncbi:MAG: hypothetical protein E7536_00825 [Ruminococcaceae bacterium]|nr:hypothetical protein [Oscillospiraceae bacterium]
MDFINEIITFLFGEGALADGVLGLGDIFNALYYKNAPILTNIYDVINDGFWKFLIGLINLFM